VCTQRVHSRVRTRRGASRFPSQSFRCALPPLSLIKCARLNFSSFFSHNCLLILSSFISSFVCEVERSFKNKYTRSPRHNCLADKANFAGNDFPEMRRRISLALSLAHPLASRLCAASSRAGYYARPLSFHLIKRTFLFTRESLRALPIAFHPLAYIYRLSRRENLMFILVTYISSRRFLRHLLSYINCGCHINHGRNTIGLSAITHTPSGTDGRGFVESESAAGKSMISKHKAARGMFLRRSQWCMQCIWNFYSQNTHSCVLKEEIFVCLGRRKAFFIKPQKLIALGCDSVEDLLPSAQKSCHMR
jgi:hypothetical protein